MKQRAEFLDVFLRGNSSSRTRLLAFALGLVMIGLLSNLGFALLVAPEGIATAWWKVIVASLILTAAAFVLFRLDRRQVVRVTVDESRLAPPRAGLIWLLGPGNPAHALIAIRHHCRLGGGQHCWFVLQEGVESVRQSWLDIEQTLTAEMLPTKPHRVYVRQLDMREAYEAVRTILDREVPEAELTIEQVIADITGATKPMTAGMVLAAITAGVDLEYVETDRDSEGGFISGTERVILADASFYLDRPRKSTVTSPV